MFGKAGRAETATDPAPLEMVETVINLKPEAEWRPGMTIDKLIAEMDEALQFPGVSNAWTMPIKARIDMLSTGIRTPVGVKVFGPDLDDIERLANEVERVVAAVPGTPSAYAERMRGGYYLDIEPDRAALARYGLTVGECRTSSRPRSAARWSPPPSRAASATASTCATRAICATNPQAIATPGAGPTMAARMIPLGQVARIRLDQGPPSDPHRERAACRLHLCRHARPRYRRLRRRGARAPCASRCKFPPGLSHRMERAIRISGARGGQAQASSCR